MHASGSLLTIVADRDGQTLGLTTIEDVVAELVGEIAKDDPLPEEGSAPGDRRR